MPHPVPTHVPLFVHTQPDTGELPNTLTAAARVGVCAPNRTELLLVMQTRLGALGVERAKDLLRLQRIQTMSPDEALADCA